jgi:predicted kinase
MDKKEKILIIVRGIPGCGKSEFAKILSDYICTADDFHMEDGEYKWTVERAGLAHTWCQKKCEGFMKEGFSPVVVANTSTTKKELKPYYDLAIGYKYKVFCVIVENRHGGKNIHSVPEVTVKAMVDRFDIKLI